MTELTNLDRALCVTTAVKPTADLVERARSAASELGATYCSRRNITVARLVKESGCKTLLIVEHDRCRLHDALSGVTYSYHPNLSVVRAAIMKRGARELFAEACEFRAGDRFLDCTVGFAAEATLAALLIGNETRVVGLESVAELAYVTRAGVRSFRMLNKSLAHAIRRVDIITADYSDYLKRCEPGEFDIIYFDPFFAHRLSGSENSVSPLYLFGDHQALCDDAVVRAREIAVRRVVVKHPKNEPLNSDLSSLITNVITTRKSRVQYSVFDVG